MGISVHSLKVFNWVCEMSGSGGAAAVLRYADCLHNPPSLERHKGPTRTVPTRQGLQTAVRSIPGEKTLEYNWYVEYMGPLPSSPRRLYIGPNRNRHFKIDFAYPVVDVNAQNTMEGVEQKLRYQFGPGNELCSFRRRNTLSSS